MPYTASVKAVRVQPNGAAAIHPAATTCCQTVGSHEREECKLYHIGHIRCSTDGRAKNNSMAIYLITWQHLPTLKVVIDVSFE